MPSDELSAMQKIEGLLSPLDESVRNRILVWANLRFNEQSGSRCINKKLTDSTDDNVSNGDKTTFATLAELVNACNPKNLLERALIGAYWTQILGGESSWQSSRINGPMSKIGMRITSVNHVLSRAQQKRPALVLTVDKTGQTAQSRKFYKLTESGVKYVENMIHGADTQYD